MSKYLRSGSRFSSLLLVMLASIALSFAAVGCGDDDDDGGGGGGSGEAYCCINGQFFDCPSGNAAEACFTSFEPGSCSPDASQNARCD